MNLIPEQNNDASQASELKRQIAALEARQRELELRNDQLRATQAQLEKSHRQYVRALQEARQRLRLALKASQMVAWEINLRNSRLLRLGAPFGIRPRTIEEFFSYVHPEDRGKVQTAITALIIDDKPLCLEYRIMDTDGQVHWVADRGILRYDPSGRPARVVGVAADITARKQMEEALGESERHFRLLAETVPAYVWTARPDGSVTYINQRWYAATGLSREQALGFGWRQALHPADQELCRQLCERSRQEGNGHELEVRMRQPDGSYRWIMSRAEPLRDEQGRITLWMGAALDIEEKKRAEAALQEADRRKDEFLAMLAHELRNPLAPMRNSVQILRRLQLVPEATRVYDMLDRQVTHMARMIDDLLDVSRIARGRILLHKQVLNVVDVVRNTVEDHREDIDAAGQKLQLELPSGPLWVHGDPIRLAQTVGNLLQNAQKFSAREDRITVRLDATEEQARLSITDTGIGIEPELLAHLFEPFVQAQQPLDRSRGGLGLGLALVKGLVDLHGGLVEAESPGVGQGSRFTLRLPLARPVEITPAAGVPASAPRQRRILVIEDNQDAAESLRMLLEMMGHRVEVAYTGAEGIQSAASFLPEIVLCDLGLPDLDGFAVARAVRTAPSLSVTHLIALTGYSDEKYLRAARDAGFEFHLIKPADPGSLEALLTSLPTAAPAQ